MSEECSWDKSRRLKKEWLENLKEGDEVAVRIGGWNTSYRTVTIQRLTRTQIIIDGFREPDRYWKKDGRRVGGSGYNGNTIEPITEEVRETMALAYAKDSYRTLSDKLAKDMQGFTSSEIDELNSFLESFNKKISQRKQAEKDKIDRLKTLKDLAEETEKLGLYDEPTGQSPE